MNYINYILVGGFEPEFYFPFIYGMSSFPLTNSIIFQDGYCTTNQKLYIYGTRLHFFQDRDLASLVYALKVARSEGFFHRCFSIASELIICYEK